MSLQIPSKGGILLEKTGKITYYIAITAFTIIILLNQIDYISSKRYLLITMDALSLMLCWGFFAFFKLQILSFRVGSAVLVYTTLTNLFVSLFYCYAQSVPVTNGFLLYVPICCANIMVIGFCNGKLHAYISGAYFLLTFAGLLLVTHDAFLLENAMVIVVAVATFSLGIAGLLYIINKVHAEEIAIRQKLHQKETQYMKEHAECLNLQLNIKQKELTTKALYLLKLVENNGAFIDELRDMHKEIKDSGMTKFNQLLTRYSIVHMETQWKEFETCFQEVHQAFYQKIQELYPGLSPAERRLAAFIRLDLSSKQIADITQTTSESVHVARSRLRKKIGLGQGENMTLFFSSL